MIPVPSICTLVRGPTMTWAPPMIALIGDHDLLRRELRLPQVELGAAHHGEDGHLLRAPPTRPCGSKPLRIAKWVSLSGPGTTSGEAAAGFTDRRAVRVGRQVEGDRDQVGVRAGGVRRLEPRVELVDVEPALAGGLAQDLGDLVPLLVRDAQPGGVGPTARLLKLTRHEDSVGRATQRPQGACATRGRCFVGQRSPGTSATRAATRGRRLRAPRCGGLAGGLTVGRVTLVWHPCRREQGGARPSGPAPSARRRHAPRAPAGPGPRARPGARQPAEGAGLLRTLLDRAGRVGASARSRTRRHRSTERPRRSRGRGEWWW